MLIFCEIGGDSILLYSISNDIIRIEIPELVVAHVRALGLLRGREAIEAVRELRDGGLGLSGSG